MRMAPSRNSTIRVGFSLISLLSSPPQQRKNILTFVCGQKKLAVVELFDENFIIFVDFALHAKNCEFKKLEPLNG